MADDIENPTIDAMTARYEAFRQAGLRCFYVYLSNGQVEVIWAHMHDDTNPAGHLNFVTVKRDGTNVIHDAFNAKLWVRLKEVVDDTQIVEKRNIH